MISTIIFLTMMAVPVQGEIVYENPAECGTPGSTCRLSCTGIANMNKGGSSIVPATGMATSCRASGYYSCALESNPPGFDWRTDWKLEKWNVVPKCGAPFPYNPPPPPPPLPTYPDPPPPDTIREPEVVELGPPPPRTFTDEVHFLSQGWHRCYSVDALGLANGFLYGPVGVYLRARIGSNTDNWLLYVWKEWVPGWNDEARYKRNLNATEVTDNKVEDANGQQLIAESPELSPQVLHRGPQRREIEAEDLRGKMVCVPAYLPSVGGVPDTIQGTTSQKGYSIGFQYTEN